jgi:hypothetical protein
MPMQTLSEDLGFTFRFADDRIIPRFHLDGLRAGQRLAVFKIEPVTGEKLDLLATASVGEGGWVDLPQPLVVRAGEAFIAEPQPDDCKVSLGKILLTTLAVAGPLALVGYVGGLAQGGGNQVGLSVCCGALGAFVVLLGYGPIAILIGALGAGAEWFSRKKKGTNRE